MTARTLREEPQKPKGSQDSQRDKSLGNLKMASSTVMSCLCLFSCLGVMVGGLVMAGAAFVVGPQWMAYPAVVIVGVGFNALRCACTGPWSCNGTEGDQVAEESRL